MASCLHLTAFCLRLSWGGRPVRVSLLATGLLALCLRLTLVWEPSRGRIDYMHEPESAYGRPQ